MELATHAATTIELHHDVEGRCNECTEMHPCPEWRLAEDWMRMRSDLTRAFRNRTGRELFELRKFACAMCSKKETGLVCMDCIAEAEDDTVKVDLKDTGALPPKRYKTGALPPKGYEDWIGKTPAEIEKLQKVEAMDETATD